MGNRMLIYLRGSVKACQFQELQYCTILLLCLTVFPSCETSKARWMQAMRA